MNGAGWERNWKGMKVEKDKKRKGKKRMDGMKEGRERKQWKKIKSREVGMKKEGK